MLTRFEATWGVRYGLFQLAFLPSLASTVLVWLFPNAQAIHLNLLCWAVNFCAICGIFHRYLLDSVKYSIKNIKTVLLTAMGGFVVYQALIYSVSAALVLLFPQFFNVNDAHLAVAVQQSYPLMVIGTVVLVPLTEEVLYRGLIFGLLPSRLSRYLVSIGVFCAIHVMGYIGYYPPLHLLICFVQYIPAGLVLALAYERSNSIFAPILIHMAVNAIAILPMR
ncbi:MAG: CPBP family intramembrane metalloprotease [Ruminococcaceae bacterium]|nr:CPBP family intramembrane metalloprotease [Oscillospiraceae bacterium]